MALVTFLCLGVISNIVYMGFDVLANQASLVHLNTVCIYCTVQIWKTSIVYHTIVTKWIPICNMGNEEIPYIITMIRHIKWIVSKKENAAITVLTCFSVDFCVSKSMAVIILVVQCVYKIKMIFISRKLKNQIKLHLLSIHFQRHISSFINDLWFVDSWR